MIAPKDRRIGWPVALVLVGFLAGSLYLVSRVHEDTVGRDAPMVVGLDAGLRDGGGDYVHHAWGSDAAAEAPPAARLYDPQRDRMHRDFPSDAGVRPPFAPLERRLRLADVRGEPPIGSDREPCWLRVLPVRVPPFNCAVRVTCDARVVYPNPSSTAGFNECTIEDGQVVRVDDRGSTEADQDPQLSLDVPRRRVRVGDRREGREVYRLTFTLAPD